MKANEAPEKLYVNSNDHLTYNGYYAFTNKMRACDIEYTRTDAFIEKVCDWLFDNLQTVSEVETPSAHHVESVPALGIITLKEFTEMFKKEIRYLLD